MPIKVLTRKEFRDLDYCPCRNPERFEFLGIDFLHGVLRRPIIDEDRDDKVRPHKFFGGAPLEFDVSPETQFAVDGDRVCDSYTENYSSEWESTTIAEFDSGPLPSEIITGSLSYTGKTEGVEPEDIKYLNGLMEETKASQKKLIYSNWGEEVITRNINYIERVEEWAENNAGEGFVRYKKSDITETITTEEDGTHELRRQGFKIVVVSGKLRKININEIEPFIYNNPIADFTNFYPPYGTRKPVFRERGRYNIDLETFSINYLDHELTSNYSLDISRDLGRGGSFTRSENWSVSSSRVLPTRVQFRIELHDQDTLKHHPGDGKSIEVDLFYDDFGGFGEPFLSYGESASGEFYDLDTFQKQEALNLVYLPEDKGIISVVNRDSSTKNNTIITFDYGYSNANFGTSLDFTLGRVATMFSEDWVTLTQFSEYSPLLEKSNEIPIIDELNTGTTRIYISPVYKVDPLVKEGQNGFRIHEWGDERLEGMVF